MEFRYDPEAPQRPEPLGRKYPDDMVFYRAEDLGVIGTYAELKAEVEQRKELAEMAKVVGTGSDPLNRYPENVAVDLGPDELASLVELGWVRELADEEWMTDKWQIANSMVRGDPLSNPAEVAAAAEIGDDAYAIVQLQDPDATAGDERLNSDDDEGGVPPAGGRMEAGQESGLGASPARSAAAAAAAPEKASSRASSSSSSEKK